MQTGAATIDGREGAAQAEPALPPIAPRLLTDLLDNAVAVHGAWTAIDFMGRTWTYAEVGEQVRRAARGLQDLGIVKGTRVGLCLPNSPYFVILYFAALRIGAIIVNFNPLYVERELEHQMRDSGTTVMVTCDVPSIHAKVAAVGEKLCIDRIILCPIAGALPPVKALLYRLFRRGEIAAMPDDRRHVSYADLVARDADPDTVERDPDDVAVLQYTGGTTGVPKGAMLTHANLAANSAQMAAHLGRQPMVQESTLGVLPMFHVFALTTVLNYSVESGAEMVLLPRFEMKQFLATAKRTRPTQFFGVPTLYAALAKLPEGKLKALSSFRMSISGGAPLPLEIRQAFEQRTHCRVVEGYGLSEASPIITCNPLDGVVKDNSCGPAFPNTILEIRDLDDPHRIVPQGEKGEVCARGPQVMKGYWNKPEDTDRVFVDGALKTGDVGYVDEDGYLFLIDRIKDLILCGGYNVYPRVIEDALYEHPAVAEAIVIGVPDAYRGQSPKAFVALHQGAVTTEQELCDFLAPRLNRIEMPREIEIRDALPKTLIGKLSKKELVAEEAAKAAS